MPNTTQVDANVANSSNAGNGSAMPSWGDALAATLPEGSDVVDQDASAEDANGAPDAGGEDKDPPFHEHPRWQQMQAKVKSLEAEVATAQTAKEQSKADAELAAYVRSRGFDNVEALNRAAENDLLEKQQAAFQNRLIEELNADIAAQKKTKAEAERELADRLKSWQQDKKIEVRMQRMAKQEIDNHINFFSSADRFPDADYEGIRERALAQYERDDFDPRSYILKQAKSSHESFQTRLEQRMANAAHKKTEEKKAPLSTERSAPALQSGARLSVPNPDGLPKRPSALPTWHEALDTAKSFLKK